MRHNGFAGTMRIRSKADTNMCLDRRIDLGDPSAITINTCKTRCHTEAIPYGRGIEHGCVFACLRISGVFLAYVYTCLVCVGTNSERQRWVYTKKPDQKGGTLSGPDHKLCFDNLQKTRGEFG